MEEIKTSPIVPAASKPVAVPAPEEKKQPLPVPTPEQAAKSEEDKKKKKRNKKKKAKAKALGTSETPAAPVSGEEKKTAMVPLAIYQQPEAKTKVASRELDNSAVFRVLGNWKAGEYKQTYVLLHWLQTRIECIPLSRSTSSFPAASSRSE